MLPRVVMPEPPEPLSPAGTATTCDPTEKPGVARFRTLVMDALGGRDIGIIRACGDGHSEHYEGRAWDWGMNANDPSESARVAELFDWLLATDARGEPFANFRRAGLGYMIWDRNIWSARTEQWTPYTGPSPHTDHVHFSFGWPGARGETSLYRFLDPVAIVPGGSRWPLAVSLGAGLALGWLATPKRWRL